MEQRKKKHRSKRLEIATLVVVIFLTAVVCGDWIYGAVMGSGVQEQLDRLIPVHGSCAYSCEQKCRHLLAGGEEEEGHHHRHHSNYDECFSHCTGTGYHSPAVHFRLSNTGYSIPQAIRFGRVPGDSKDLPRRMFVASQHGLITLTHQNVGKGGSQTRVLNLSPLIQSSGGGLTGFELHPHFHSNGRFFVWYSQPRYDGNNVSNTPNCSSEGGYGSSGPSDDRRNFGTTRPYLPDVYTDIQVLEEYYLESANHNATFVSRLLTVKHFFNTHYSSDALRFDENGKLLVYVSDGGCIYDQFGVGQNRAFLPGKVIAVDVGGGGIDFQCDAPVALWSELQASCPAWYPSFILYASGCREGGHISLDKYDGLLNRYLSSDGESNQDAVYRFGWESNFGWVTREGQLCCCVEGDPLIDPVCDFNQSILDCNALITSNTGSYTNPMVALNHRMDRVSNVVGGFVYRGEDLPCSLRGRYLLGSNDGNGTFRLYSARTQPGEDDYGKIVSASGLINQKNYLSVFGYDEESGRIYVGLHPSPSGATQPLTTGQIFLLVF